MPKSFRPIILLNILGKLIEKVISDKLQFHTISNNFIYQSQLEGLKFKSITDAGIVLTHIIHLGWVKNLPTSTLGILLPGAFDYINKLIDDVVQTGYVRQVGYMKISDRYGDIFNKGHLLFAIFDD